jgi:isocitrate dehydrogenase
MAYSVTLIPGDGIGTEVSGAARRVLESTGVQFEWDIQEAGVTALEKHGDVLPESVIDSIRKNQIALKGPVTTPVGGGFRSVNVALRHALEEDPRPLAIRVDDRAGIVPLLLGHTRCPQGVLPRGEAVGRIL